MSTFSWCAFPKGLRNALLRAALSLLWCGPALAGPLAPPSAIWNQGTVPFIPLWTCDNQLKTQFPDTADTIKNELVQAAEEWFIGSGSNIRFYYLGTLLANDPACADMPTVIAQHRVGAPPGAPPDGPSPPRWSVVLTAAAHLTNQFSPLGVKRCHYAITDLWKVPPPAGAQPHVPGIERARITLVAGQMCGGSLEPWPWLDPSAPQNPQTPPQTLSPARVLMKMLGHALGLGEEIGTADTVMAPIDPNTVDHRWHLSEPIVRLMRSAYGPARSSPYWAETQDGGKTWQVLPNTPRGQGDNSLGLVACHVVLRPNVGVVFGPSSTPTYLVAETSIDASGKSFVTTYLVDAQRHNLSGARRQGESNRKPSILCGTSFMVVGFVDPTGAVQLRQSNDGVTWRPAQIPAGWRSAHAPILAEARWADGIVAATSTSEDGLHFLFSGDGGLSYVAASSLVASHWAPRFPFGLVCPAAKQRCYVAFTDYEPGGDFRFHILPYWLQGGTLVGGPALLGDGISDLGLAMAPTENGQGYALARRYGLDSMSSGTPSAALDQLGAGVQADADAGLWTFTDPPFSRSVSDSPVGLFFDDLSQSLVALGTWNYWYNGFGFVVASAKQKAKRERQVADPVRGSAFGRGK